MLILPVLGPQVIFYHKDTRQGLHDSGGKRPLEFRVDRARKGDDPLAGSDHDIFAVQAAFLLQGLHDIADKIAIGGRRILRAIWRLRFHRLPDAMATPRAAGLGKVRANPADQSVGRVRRAGHCGSPLLAFGRAAASIGLRLCQGSCFNKIWRLWFPRLSRRMDRPDAAPAQGPTF